jgi:hypothetical protein
MKMNTGNKKDHNIHKLIALIGKGQGRSTTNQLKLRSFLLSSASWISSPQVIICKMITKINQALDDDHKEDEKNIFVQYNPERGQLELGAKYYSLNVGVCTLLFIPTLDFNLISYHLGECSAPCSIIFRWHWRWQINTAAVFTEGWGTTTTPRQRSI